MTQHIAALLASGALFRNVTVATASGSAKSLSGALAAARVLRHLIESTVGRTTELSSLVELVSFGHLASVSDVVWDEANDKPVVSRRQEWVQVEQLRDTQKFEKRVASFIRRTASLGGVGRWTESRETQGERARVPGRRKRALDAQGGGISLANRFREHRKQVSRAIAGHALRSAGIPATLVNKATAPERKKAARWRAMAVRKLKAAGALAGEGGI